MPNLKEKLIKIYEEDLKKKIISGNSYNIDEYDRMIRYGSLGELTEDYYLFIYRDAYRNPAYYGAVIFFNKRDRNGRNLTISCFEETGDERERSIYIYAAIYFVKNNYSNTLNINGKVELVFNMARDKINKFQRGMVKSRIPGIEDFDYDIKNQKIKLIELTDEKITNNLNKYKNIEFEEIKENITDISNINYDIGISLTFVEYGDLFDKKQELIFILNYISLKNKKKKLNQDLIKRINFDGYGTLVKDYTNLYGILYESGVNENKIIKILNELYFDKFSSSVFNGDYKGDFSFYDNSENKFYDIKIAVFKKISIKFAPIDNKCFEVFINFYLTNDTIVFGRNNYQIRIVNEKVHIFVLDKRKNYFLKPDENKSFINIFKLLYKKKEFKFEEFGALIDLLNKEKTNFIVFETELMKRYKFNVLPTPIIKIINENGKYKIGNKIILEFDYKESVKSYLNKNPGIELYAFERDKNFEKACLLVLDSDPELKKDISYDNFNQAIISHYGFDNNAMNWIIKNGEKYIKKGFRIYIEDQNKYIGNIYGTLRVSTRSNIDWIEFKPKVKDSISDSESSIKSILDEKNGLVEDKEGKLHLITDKEIEQLKRIFLYGEKNGDYYKVPSANFILISKLYDERMKGISNIRNILQKTKMISNFEGIKDYYISENFKGKLREYQKAGFNWLNFLYEYNFSGCLADDMGLGKTVQTLAFLQSLKDSGKLSTSLLIVPVSAISNWESEIEKFTKTIKYLIHIGVKRKKSNIGWKEYDIIISSYATLRNDIDYFKEYNFDYIILDESQNIKNYHSQTSKAIKLIRGKNKLALSGTPIENNSFELWSLFDFLMPGYLGTIAWFKNKFEKRNGFADTENRNELLKKMVFPFMLRRKKEDVEKELPPKTEIIIKLKMDSSQREAYTETAENYIKDLQNENNKERKNNALKIIEGILRLRQICLFPKLSDNKYSDVKSIKAEYFKEQIKEIIAEGHKVLVFSQFTAVLANLRKIIEDQNISYSYLDGKTSLKKREEEINKFQKKGESSVFLLSLKAGGVAINLTEADYVIIFDPWWNPAVEAQAIDRAHRIGQKKNIIVYRMVVEDSIEEKMLFLQDKKKDLFESIITTDASIFKKLSKEELLQLFK